MTKRLSTSLTFILKFIFPTLWIAGYSYIGFQQFSFFNLSGIGFVFVFIFGSLICYYVFFRAKKVEVDDKFLYISNFRREIKVPLEGVKDVTENIYLTPRPIFIELKHETEFGKKVMFIGSSQYYLFLSPHPVVQELKQRVWSRRAKLEGVDKSSDIYSNL